MSSQHVCDGKKSEKISFFFFVKVYRYRFLKILNFIDDTIIPKIGEVNCPYGQDERNCGTIFFLFQNAMTLQLNNSNTNLLQYFILTLVRLSERNGDLGKGILEIYKVNLKKWVPACVSNWNQNSSPTMVCSLLGYNSVNSSRITMRNTNQTLTPSSTNSKDPNNIARMYQRKKTNLIKEFGSCSSNENHPVIDLTCSNYGN